VAVPKTYLPGVTKRIEVKWTGRRNVAADIKSTQRTKRPGKPENGRHSDLRFLGGSKEIPERHFGGSIAGFKFAKVWGGCLLGAPKRWANDLKLAKASGRRKETSEDDKRLYCAN